MSIKTHCVNKLLTDVSLKNIQYTFLLITNYSKLKNIWYPKILLFYPLKKITEVSVFNLCCK